MINNRPTAVIGGVFVVVCGIIATSGLQVMKNVAIGEREMYIIALPMIMTLALTFIPQDYVGSLPQTIQYLFSSPVATASLLAITLNKLLP